MFVESLVPVGALPLNVMQGPANGPPLIFFHGVIRRWQTFLPVLPALSSRWQIWGLDFPGHGKSSWFTSEREYLVADYIAIATQWARQQFQSPVAIYGHSLGAMVALGVAAALGDQASAAVLEDPPFETMGSRIGESWLAEYFSKLQPFASDGRPIAVIARELAEITATDPQTGTKLRLGDARDAAALRYMAYCLQSLDPAVLKPIVHQRWLAGYDWTDCFRRLACPAFLLQADEKLGGMLAESDASQAEALGSDVTCLKFAAAGHNLHVARTQDLLNVVTAFLEPHRP